MQTIDAGASRMIDFYRAIAILHVMFAHLFVAVVLFAPIEKVPAFIASTPDVLNVIWQTNSVDLIFVVSTFLLTFSMINEFDRTGGISYRAHLVKRLSRIIPLYYLALLIYGAGDGFPIANMLLSMVFMGQLLSSHSVVPVGWSMETMLLVYLILPFVLLALLRASRPWLILGLLLIASCGVRVGFFVQNPLDFSTIYPDVVSQKVTDSPFLDQYYRVWYRLPPFVIGIGLAWVAMRHSNWLTATSQSRAMRLGLTVIGLVLIFVTNWLPTQRADAVMYQVTPDWLWQLYWIFVIPVFSLGAALLFWVGLSNSGGIVAKIPGPWVLFSQNIFPIYLFHMPLLIPAAYIGLMGLTPDLLGAMQLWQAFVIFGLTCLFSLGLAMLITRYFELPIQRYLRNRFL